MLTARQAQLAFIPVMVLIMSGVISCALTAWNRGLGAEFLDIWLHNWGMALTVALPTAWLVVPRLQAVLTRLTRASKTSPLEADPS
jgi:hypothetical protein